MLCTIHNLCKKWSVIILTGRAEKVLEFTCYITVSMAICVVHRVRKTPETQKGQ